MGERTQRTNGFPEPGQLVGALQTFLRRTPGAPEYGSIVGGGHDRVVYGPFFTSFVLGQTCEAQGTEPNLQDIAARTKEIHSRTMDLRFDSGRIVPSVGKAVLQEYERRRLADPHVEVARRLAVGLSERDHESHVVARDVQVLLSRVALDGDPNGLLVLPEQTDPTSLQAPVPDVA